MNRLKEKKLDILLFLLVGAILVWAFLEFHFTLNNSFQKTLTYIVGTSALCDQEEYLAEPRSYYTDLQRTAQLAGESAPEIPPTLNGGKALVRMEYIGVDGLSSEPESKNYSGEAFFTAAINGQSTVATKKEDGRQLTVISVPILQDGHSIGVLRGYYDFPQLNGLTRTQYTDLTRAVIALSLKFLLILFILVQYIYFLLRKKTHILEEQRSQLDTLTSNIPGGVQCCTNDEVLTIRSLSEGFFTLTGFTREEIAINFNNQYISMIHPVDRPQVRQLLADSVGDVYEIQYRLLHKSGATLWILDKGQIIFERNGGSKLYSVLLDVSDLKRTETELEQKRRELEISNQKYSLLIGQTGCVIYDFDPSEHQITFNNSFKGVFGYNPPDENFPASFIEDDLVHPEDSARFQSFYQSPPSNGETREESFRILRSGRGYLRCKIWAAAVSDEKHTFSRIIGRIVPETD